MENTHNQYRIHVYSEYDVLKKVIMCQPQYMMIRDVINETQKQYKNEGINIEKALKQYDQFVRTLKDHGVEVILLPYHKKYPEQVFTRDIGFVLGETIFVADMKSQIRMGEDDVFKLWLEDEDLSYYNIKGHEIEGGDVLIDRDCIYIGLSSRTKLEAVHHIELLLGKQFEIITIDFNEKYLHLDCVLNIVSEEVALIFPEALRDEDLIKIKNKYDCIEVTKDEQFTLGTNVLCIGNKKILSLPVNKQVNQELIKRGFEVIDVDINEIIKSGGSFRCCTLPIEREHHPQIKTN